MGDLHQVRFGNTIHLRYLGDGAQAVGLLRHIHQQAQGVVGEGGEAHQCLVFDERDSATDTGVPPRASARGRMSQGTKRQR